MATPNRGYTTIPGSETPDVPYWVNRALGEVDTDVEAVHDRVVNLEVQAGTSPGGINDAAMDTVYNNPDSTFRQSVEADRAATRADIEADYQAQINATKPVIDGWHDLRTYLKNGWTASADTGHPRWRKVTDDTGTYVEFRGQVVNPDVTGNSILCYMGELYRPKSVEYFGGINARTSVSMGAIIGPDGIFTMWQSSASGGLRSLNNIKYWLD